MNRGLFKAFLRTSAAFALLALVAGCGGGESETDCSDGGTCPADAGAPAPCTVRFAGNYAGSMTTSAPCATLAEKKDAWTLSMMLSPAQPAVGTTIQLDLGRAPTPGAFTSETIATWSAIGVGATGKCATGGSGCQPLCEYSAGNDSAPQGNFTLMLSAIDVDASTPVAHGQLEVSQDVHAGAFVDCGRGDFEEIAVQF